MEGEEKEKQGERDRGGESRSNIAFCDHQTLPPTRKV